MFLTPAHPAPSVPWFESPSTDEAPSFTAVLTQSAREPIEGRLERYTRMLEAADLDVREVAFHRHDLWRGATLRYAPKFPLNDHVLCGVERTPVHLEGTRPHEGLERVAQLVAAMRAQGELIVDIELQDWAEDGDDIRDVDVVHLSRARYAALIKRD